MARVRDADRLADGALAGDRRLLAQLISLIETNQPAGRDALARLFSRTGRAHIVGITGSPGAGKSTLADELIRQVRQLDHHVAVLAVDPSSPFTGGAILGDRVRMQEHSSDPGVYIRSMASRGHLGGISEATPKAVAVLDAVGFPYIFVETVGVGQAEVEIVESADTTILVVTPGWGDSIQAAKAGLLEIGDVFVVNKADRPGVQETVRDLNQMLDFGGDRDWRPPVVTTVATNGEGIAELWTQVVLHQEYLEESGELAVTRSARLEKDLEEAVVAELQRRARAAAAGDRFQSAVAEVVARRVDPWTAADRIVDGEGTAQP